MTNLIQALSIKLESLGISLTSLLDITKDELTSYELGSRKPSRKHQILLLELSVQYDILVHDNGTDLIDTTFEVYNDSNNKDPDSYSPTLNHYHYLLWHKPLPDGPLFDLRKVYRDRFLLEDQGTNQLNIQYSSDSIIHPFHYWKCMTSILEQVPKHEIEAFHRLGSTVGGYIIFPAQRINGKPTINTARGLHGKIKDRFDLTLECIRLHYLNKDNPLANVLNRYEAFFKLFTDFKGYVQFFLLDDLVEEDYTQIRFWHPFDGFDTVKPVPRTVNEYQAYMQNVMQFIKSRNQRILTYVDQNLKKETR